MPDAYRPPVQSMVGLSSSLDAGKGYVRIIARVVLSLMNLETRFAQNTPPHVQREYSHSPVIALNREASLFTNEIEDRCFVLLICGIGVIYILDEDNVDVASRGRGGAGPVLPECLGRHIRGSDQDSSGLQMNVCSVERCYKISSARHV